MDRRKYLMVTGGMLAIAGCTGDSDDDVSASDDDKVDSSSGDNTKQEGQEDDGEAVTTHQIGDTFSVGDGDQVVEYIVNSATTYESIGGEYSKEEPDGIFVVILMQLINQSKESFNVTSNAYSMVDSEGRTFDPDTEAGFYLSTDDRVEAEAISFDQLNPGLSTDGALVFDVPKNEAFGLLIEPTGFLDTGDSHLVQLGST
jgi:hypothetical protein